MKKTTWSVLGVGLSLALVFSGCGDDAKGGAGSGGAGSGGAGAGGAGAGGAGAGGAGAGGAGAGGAGRGGAGGAGAGGAGAGGAGAGGAGAGGSGATCAGNGHMEAQTCAHFCELQMAVCTFGAAAPAQYASMAACMTACATFPMGTAADAGGNTLGCRIYHTCNAASNPPASTTTHCPHTSMSGGGVCG